MDNLEDMNPVETVISTETTQNEVCSKCGAELQEGQVFCPKCGQKTAMAVDVGTDNKQKNKIVTVILVIVLVVAGITGYFVINGIRQKNTEKEVKNYVSNARKFYNTVLNSGTSMEEIGNEIQSNWRTFIFDNNYKFSSIEDAVYSAQDSQVVNVKYVKVMNSDIEKMYTDLMKVPENSDLSGVKEAVIDVYDAYVDMYECVMNVKGNYNQFTSDFSDSDNALAKAINKLDKMIKSSNKK